MSNMNFNCGEFKPGKEPSNPGVSSVIPAIVIGIPTDPLDPPGANIPEYYKCIEKNILCPPGTTAVGPLVVPGIPNIQRIIRNCVKCDPNDNDPFCVAKTTLPQCVARCQNSLINDCIREPQIPQRPGGGNTGGPGGGTTGASGVPQPFPGGGGPSTGGGGGISTSSSGPITGGQPIQRQFACVITAWTWCPRNNQLGGDFLQSVTRSCVECNKKFDGSFETPPNTPVIPPNNRGLNNNVACNFTSLAACSRSCRSEVFNCPPLGPITGPNLPGVFIPGSGGATSSTEPPNTGTEPRPGENSTVSNQTTVVTIRDPINQSTSVFDPTYNLVTYPYDPQRSLRMGTARPGNESKIKIQVSEHVANLVNNAKSKAPWNELDFQAIKDKEILESLPERLLEAFNRLQYIDGQLIPYTQFVKMYKRHLFEGTLDELDPTFYINESKKTDPFVFGPTSDRSLRERAALGTIREDAIVADTNRERNPSQERLSRRSKAVLKDVLTNVSVENCSGTDVEVNLDNYGLFVDDVSCNALNVPLGEGDGYYLPTTLCDEREEPLMLNTQVSASFFQGPATRNTALNLVSKKAVTRISVETSSNVNEFEVNDAEPEYVPRVMFFKLDLSTVGDVKNQEDLITETSANYVLMPETDQGLIDINRFLRSHGNSVTRLNMDYRDPMLQYMEDSATFVSTQKDITFRKSVSNRSGDGFSLLRNIPFGIVVVPGMGSRHNPFNARSELESVNPTIVRSFTYISNPMSNDSALEKKYLLEEEGVARFGLVEDRDAQNIVFYYNPDSEIYKKTYFVSGEYTSEQPPMERSFEGRIVRIIEDQIKTNFDVTSITNWDLFRRFDMGIVGAYYFKYPSVLMENIHCGWRGVIVNNVVSKDINNPTGLTEDKRISNADDLIILHERDR